MSNDAAATKDLMKTLEDARGGFAVLRHWELSDRYIAEVLEHCTVDRFEVFGAPSDAVRAAFGQLSGVDVTIHPRLTGDLRLDGAAPARRA